MDASEMYPEGFHPVVKDNKLDWSGEVEPQGTRTEKPPKYYLLDFGLARQYEEDQPHHVWGPGTDTSVPEFQTGNPHPIDSFAVDVYCVGNMIRTEFLDVGLYVVYSTRLFNTLHQGRSSTPGTQRLLRLRFPATSRYKHDATRPQQAPKNGSGSDNLSRGGEACQFPYPSLPMYTYT
jgi:hypothetical protein